MTTDDRKGRTRTRGVAASEPPLRREERKQRTRDNLLEAALRLMQQGRSFTGLGLREITREAGVVPTSFYRHFRDMDELGLALVEESAIMLRRLLREARRLGHPGVDMVRRSVEIYVGYVRQHPLQFMFISGERSGGSPLIRQAIRQEIDYFTSELCQDLRHLGMFSDISQRTSTLVCGLIVTTMLNAATDVLDTKPSQSQQMDELIAQYTRQLNIIFIGGLFWQQAKRQIGETGSAATPA